MRKLFSRFVGKIQDLIYNLNDIVVALMIVGVASFIIYWRIQVVMDYPSYIKSQNTRTAEEVDFSNIDMNKEEALESLNTDPEFFEASEGSGDEETTTTTTTGDGVVTQSGAKTSQENQKEENFTTKEDTKITIPSGSSGEKIAGILLQQGLISSKSDFLNMLVEKKADTKLKAGTFTIPAGSSMENIIKIITK